MLTVTELLKILDKVPLIKDLKPLPSKVEELERRIAALETRLANTARSAFCEHCGSGNVERIGSVPHPTFGRALGKKLPKFRCHDCGEETIMDDS